MKRILVLHALNSSSRMTSIIHAYALPEYFPENLYIFHHLNAPVTEALMSISFDGVILNYCFLSYLQSDNHNYRNNFGFIRDMQCAKIAICQDDYTRNEMRDDWLQSIGINEIYSPIEQHLDILYPKCSAAGTGFHIGLTGYVSTAQNDIYKAVQKPWHERTIDIGTRVRDLPAYYGSHGIRKGKMVEPFKTHCQNAGFVVDMSTDPKDVITASGWLRFMGNCKFTLGSKGGASLADPTGSIRNSVEEYLDKHPRAEFSDIETACFPGMDMKYVYSAISPRLFEAASLNICQILTRDNWPGGLVEYEDYIPIDDDLANVNEVISIMRDENHCQQIANNCRIKLIDSGNFDYSTYASRVLSHIPDNQEVLSSTEISALDEHFSVLEPFAKLRQVYGGALERVFCRYLELNQRAGQLDIAYNLLSCNPSSYTGSWRSMLDNDLPPPNIAYLAGIAEVCHLIHSHNPSLLNSARKIAGAFLNNEISTINLLAWDMCEAFLNTSQSA